MVKQWDRVEEYAPWVTTGFDTAAPMPTTDLPDDVVKTPFNLILDSRTVVGEPRMGGYWVSLNFGGRLNPVDLTAEEREYIVGVLQSALDNLPEAHEEEIDDA